MVHAGPTRGLRRCVGCSAEVHRNDQDLGNTVKKPTGIFDRALDRRNGKARIAKGQNGRPYRQEKAYLKYYMHGVGHYLGLDVHDAGRYFSDQEAKHSRPFAPGMA